MAMSAYWRAVRSRVGSGLLLMPGVAAVVRDGSNAILCQRRGDGGWSLPAGGIEPGESPQAAVVREVAEETGLEVRVTRLLGVFGGSGYRVTYPNGDEVEYTVSLFECEVGGGRLGGDGEETVELRYFPADALPPMAVTYPL